MKKIGLLLMMLCCSLSVLSQRSNCEEGMNTSPLLPQACPYNEELYCKMTTLFFKKSNLITPIKFGYNNEIYIPIYIKVDSLGRYINHSHYLSKYNRITDSYIEKVVRFFVWDISMMKVSEFHDLNNSYEIHIFLRLNNKRKVIIKTQAEGKFDTSLYILCSSSH